MKARSYPFNGGDPLAYSPKGFLWNAAVKAGKSVRVYGEFVNKPKIVDKTAPNKKSPAWKDLWDDSQAGGGRFEITADTDNAAEATPSPALHRLSDLGLRSMAGRPVSHRPQGLRREGRHAC